MVACPYCYGEIDERAHACRHCGRDLYLIKPLLNRIGSIERQLEALAAGSTGPLESRISALELELASSRLGQATVGAIARSAVAGGSSENATAAKVAEEPAGALRAPSAAEQPTQARPARTFRTDAALCLGIPLALLLAAHLLIVIVYDLKPIYLRGATLLLPLPFGYFMSQWHPQRFGKTLLLSFVTASVAVLAMSAFTGVIDRVPIFPQDWRDAREFVEFSASIGFSFLTGMLLGRLPEQLKHATPNASGLVVFVARYLVVKDVGGLNVTATVKKVHDTVATFTPVVTAAIAAFTGLRALLGV